MGDIPCSLKSGGIAKISANVPWSNPLSASIGFSLSGLDLTFEVSKKDMVHPSADVHNIASSVASVAETFIHDELDNQEEAFLRDSFHEDYLTPGHFQEDGNRPLPGFTDPFLDAPDSASPAERDPEGISIFARLIERLLARFNFDASNSRITLVNPGHASLTVKIGSIAYSTEDLPTDAELLLDTGVVCQTRSLVVTGVSVSVQALNASIRGQTPTASSPAMEDYDSEMDEEAQMMMSQSILSLPVQEQLIAKPTSPALSTISSATSSMYESAISHSKPVDQTIISLNSVPMEAVSEEQPLLTFVEPISIRLTTPPPYIASDLPPGHDNGQRRSESADTYVPHSGDKMKLQVSLGTIAVSASAQSVRLIIQWVEKLHLSASPPTVTAPQPTVAASLIDLDKFDCRLRCDSIVLYLVPSNCWIMHRDELVAAHTYPLHPPRLTQGYLRLFVQTIDITFSPPSSPLLAQPSKHLSTCSITDISLMAFHSLSLGSTHNLISPIFITDQQLLTSYRNDTHGSNNQRDASRSDGRDQQLATFEVIDWTNDEFRGGDDALHRWRTRHPLQPDKGDIRGVSMSPKPAERDKALSKDTTTLSPVQRLSRTSIQDAPALFANVFSDRQAAAGISGGIEIVLRTAPVHVFLDLASLPTVSSALAEISSTSNKEKTSRAKSHPATSLESDLADEIHNETHATRFGAEIPSRGSNQEQTVLGDWEARQQGTTLPRSANGDEVVRSFDYLPMSSSDLFPTGAYSANQCYRSVGSNRIAESSSSRKESSFRRPCGRSARSGDFAKSRTRWDRSESSLRIHFSRSWHRPGRIRLASRREK